MNHERPGDNASLTVQAEGATIASALAALLAQLSLKVAKGAAPGDRSIRWQCEATTETALTAAALDAISAAAEDQGAAIAGIELDGVRPVEGGFRCWGTITVGSTDAPARSLRVIGRPHLEQGNSGWRIAVTVQLG